MGALQRLIDEAPRFFTYFNVLLLAQATGRTMVMAVSACVLGFALGFMLATLRAERVVRHTALRWPAIAYVELFRRVPTLVLLMVVFFAYQVAGYRVEVLIVAITAIVLRAAAQFAENIRAGFESIRATQWDAAETMNLSALQTLRLVILPQAWRVILPPANIGAVGLVKSTSLASQLSVLELTFAARQLNLRGFSALICYGTILVIYFAISWLVGRLGVILEARLVPGRRQA
jgi:polar amino acid transport system permease protein